MKFADKENAQKIIKDLYPDAQNITFVEHGYDNLVVLVDEKYAVRFPRNGSAYGRSQYEKHVLRDLVDLQELAIPRILGEGTNPPYLITTFLSGQHISAAEINTFSVSKQKEIGEKVAEFAYAMHSLLSVEKAMVIRKELKLDEQEEEPWDVYFENLLSKKNLPDKKQDEIVKKYYAQWTSLSYTTPMVVVHDDLHTENLLFNGQDLVGVLDFGDTNIGTPEQELRQLYRINETVLDAAINKYEQLSGFPLNKDAIKIWCITQELAVYCERMLDANPKVQKNHPSFDRSVRNLTKWFPKGKWEDTYK